MVWECLDDLQRAAVAEAVHSPAAEFNAGLFRAKYGRDPNWGSEDKHGYDRKPSALCLFIYRNRIIPNDLAARLLTFVPAPREATIAALDQLPPVYALPFERWNAATKMREHGTEDVPLSSHETERAAQRELLSVLRLVDAGKVAVSDKTADPQAPRSTPLRRSWIAAIIIRACRSRTSGMTRTPDRFAPSPGLCLSRREDSRSSRERDYNSPRQAARRSPIRLPGPSPRSGRSGWTRPSWTSWRVSNVSKGRPGEENARSPPYRRAGKLLPIVSPNARPADGSRSMTSSGTCKPGGTNSR